MRAFLTNKKYSVLLMICPVPEVGSRPIYFSLSFLFYYYLLFLLNIFYYLLFYFVPIVNVSFF